MSSQEYARSLPVILGQKIQLRQIQEEDADPLLSMLSDPQIRQTIYSDQLASPLRAQRILSQMLGRDRQNSLHLGVSRLGEDPLIGVVSLQHWRQMSGQATLGFLIDSAYWNRGYASEAVQLLLRMAFDKLRMKRIEGRCQSSNTASERIMIKNGMQLDRMITGSPFAAVSSGELGGAENDIRVYYLTEHHYQLQRP